MKSENKELLKYGIKLFILGYKWNISKWLLERMAEKRLKKNKPLCDSRLLKINRLCNTYSNQWEEYEKKFLELKAARG